jgi:DUF3093 family protein
VTYFDEEQRFGGWVWALIAIIGAAVLGAAAMGTDRPGTIPALVFAVAIVSFIALLFGLAHLDVDVDRDAIHIAFHMLWPTRHIALGDVRSARATQYSPLSYGGWGVHYMFLRGWVFNTGGNEGVLVETNDGARVMIGSQRAGELEAAIARAIADRAR